MTTNQPKTRKVAALQNVAKKFLLLSERKVLNAARITINAKIMTSPIKIAPLTKDYQVKS
jgi:hypothetical protein